MEDSPKPWDFGPKAVDTDILQEQLLVYVGCKGVREAFPFRTSGCSMPVAVFAQVIVCICLLKIDTWVIHESKWNTWLTWPCKSWYIISLSHVQGKITAQSASATQEKSREDLGDSTVLTSNSTQFSHFDSFDSFERRFWCHRASVTASGPLEAFAEHGGKFAAHWGEISAKLKLMAVLWNPGFKYTETSLRPLDTFDLESSLFAIYFLIHLQCLKTEYEFATP